MKVTTVLLMSLSALTSFAQQKEHSPYEKFGKVTLEEVQRKQYPIDSSAGAVVLSDIGEAAIVGNNKGWFSIESKRHKVVHILNKQGYDEATVEIPLYTNGSEEESVTDIKAVTYTAENGKLVETKMEKSAIFKNKINKSHVVEKFTLPNVKEGCVIEFQYVVESEFIRTLDPWVFQSTFPTLWSEFHFTVPNFYTYAFLSHGYFPLLINERTQSNEHYTVRETRTAEATEAATFTSDVTNYRWAMKDIPAFREEGYTSSMKNHISRIDMMLASRNYPLSPHDYIGTWSGLAKALIEDEYFGRDLKSSNGWLSDDMKGIMAGASTDMAKAQKIFAFVRDNFSCTNHNDNSLNASLKTIYKARKGSVADINLLLIAMLNHAGLNADPVLLSTRTNGYALDMYPIINQYNYVVGKLTIDGQDLFLDASQSGLGFNKLPPFVYNGSGRIITDEATPINFSSDSILERKVTILSLGVDDKDKSRWVGVMNQTPGYFESLEIRDKVKTSGKAELFKKIQKDFSPEGKAVKITDPEFDSLESYDLPVALKYSVAVPVGDEDILYVNPMFGEGYRENPFKSAQRFYPVEMPYTTDENYLLTIAVPEGYTVDELPKPVRVKLDDKSSGYFEYLISQTGDIISLRSRIKFNRTVFMPEEYEALREFFNLIVKKHNEQIVFKKKK